MGLFRTKRLIRDDHLGKLIEVATQAYNLFPGSLVGDVLSYKGSEVDLADPVAGKQFKDSLRRTLEEATKAPRPLPRWAVMYEEIDEETDEVTIAALLVAKSFLLLDAVAQAESQFPSDSRVQRLRLELSGKLLSVLQRYFGPPVTLYIGSVLPNFRQHDWEVALEDGEGSQPNRG